MVQNHRLPKKWDSNQASSYLELSQNGLTVSFKRNVSLQGDKDPSGVVRSDYPIPSSIGLYYFEVEIRHGIRGCLGVGLSKEGGDLNRMPGWDPSCFGYHGDDGNFFSACGHGSSYGPKFVTGDVIGCGIDTLLYHVFFTKNGKHLGIAYRGSEPFEKLYPTVGLKTPGEQLHANFGQKSFMFDYDNYRDSLRLITTTGDQDCEVGQHRHPTTPRSSASEDSKFRGQHVLEAPRITPSRRSAITDTFRIGLDWGRATNLSALEPRRARITAAQFQPGRVPDRFPDKSVHYQVLLFNLATEGCKRHRCRCRQCQCGRQLHTVCQNPKMFELFAMERACIFSAKMAADF
uniref:B30.2/SPRY domain-containing protein n=1 Tax=Caenorhabditis japonica TaxID=281687 RepID=A0A8R1HGV0_CAEJA